jgi:hypothetical protein
MTEQKKREKVIKGLEHCIADNCDLCPYDENVDCPGFDPTPKTLLADVLALLKAQEPRVIDFDDVVGGDECWLEAVNGACGYADCYACTGTGEVQVFRCNFDNPQYIMASDYLKTWRCWTSRPTAEQREATPWQA